MEGKRKKDDNTKNTLLTYFSKKSRNNKESCDDDHLNQTKTNDPETQNIVLSVDQPSCSTLKQDEIIDNELETNFRSNDIGLFTNCTLTDADKKLNRLNGLAMLAVHRNVKVDPEEVLNELALRPRRVDLLL